MILVKLRPNIDESSRIENRFCSVYINLDSVLYWNAVIISVWSGLNGSLRPFVGVFGNFGSVSMCVFLFLLKQKASQPNRK